MISRKNFIIIIAALILAFTSTGLFGYFSLAGKYKSALSDKEVIFLEVNKLKEDNSDFSKKLEDSSKEYKKELDALKEQLGTKQKELDSLKQQLNSKQKELDSVPKLDQLYIDKYSRRNLSDPQKVIVEDLMKRVDLIPQKAVLGGVMKIENVALLSPDYAYATYSDGHILGHMILKFYVSNDGKIDWQLIHYTTT
jgi:Skp family chaperone for outer membrane proteins